MSLTHNLVLAWNNGGTTPQVNVTVPVSGDSENNMEIAVAHSVTDQADAMAFVKTKLQAIVISSPQTVTLKTNASGGGAQDTIVITANKPFIWYTGCGLANPFVNDVTAAFWTNAGGTAAFDCTVSVRLLKNA